MAGGFGQFQRDPQAKKRTRRALAKLNQTTLLVTNTGVYIDADGKIAIRLDPNATLTQSASGLSANAALTALSGVAVNGLLTRTAANTYAARTLTAPAAGLSITNPAGTAGNPTFAFANDLNALENLASTGIACRTAADTWAQRTLTAPAAGMTITNPAGIAGNPTFAFANDLNALEGLASTGLAARTAADTWAQRTITGTANQITVTNGDGVAGNPTLATPQNIHTAATPTFGGLTITSIVTMSGTSVTLTDGVNLVAGTTTGSKIGSLATQKLGFWGAAPVVQPATGGAAATFVANTSGIANDTATFDGYTLGQVVKALRNIGLLA